MANARYLTVFGHDELKERLSRAVEFGRLPQSLLLHGPRGIGKQRLGLWLAAALSCSGPPPRPCAKCLSCRLAERLGHPDIHWFFPIPRPQRTSGAEQLEKKLEDRRSAMLEERRLNPYHQEEPEGASGIYVGAVHTIRRLAQKTPAMGPVKVLVIGRAETMVPQTASPEAANALLKLLEEPPADTTIILTSDVPGALLTTIRSRVQAIRVSPLSRQQVREFLESELDLAAEEAGRLAAQSGGSVGMALELVGDEYEDMRATALDLVRAALDGRQAARLAAAHSFPSFGARGAFARVLAATRSVLRDLLADAAGAEGAVSDPETVATLMGGERQPNAHQLVQALDAVDQAWELADRNVNPQLIVVHLLKTIAVDSERVALDHVASEGS